MKNKNYAFLLISGILGIITGILYCLTIFGAIVGIPLIIGASKYLAWAKVSNEELAVEKDNLMLWGVVFTVLMFPAGAIALIPPITMDKDKASTTVQADSGKEYQPTQTTDDKKSKLDRLSELSALKEQGLIDERDFEIAKKKILSEE